jgi:hypothetical protein
VTSETEGWAAAVLGEGAGETRAFLALTGNRELRLKHAPWADAMGGDDSPLMCQDNGHTWRIGNVIIAFGVPRGGWLGRRHVVVARQRVVVWLVDHWSLSCSVCRFGFANSQN